MGKVWAFPNYPCLFLAEFPTGGIAPTPLGFRPGLNPGSPPTNRTDRPATGRSLRRSSGTRFSLVVRAIKGDRPQPGPCPWRGSVGLPATLAPAKGRSPRHSPLVDHLHQNDFFAEIGAKPVQVSVRSLGKLRLARPPVLPLLPLRLVTPVGPPRGCTTPCCRRPLRMDQSPNLRGPFGLFPLISPKTRPTQGT